MPAGLDPQLSGWLRLLITPKVGRKTARQLLSAFGLPEIIFAQSLATLRTVVSDAAASALLSPVADWQALCADTHEWLSAAPDHRTILTLADAHYPASLLELEDPPLMLFLQGQIQHMPAIWTSCAAQGIAIVGSRNPTAQGVNNARAMAKELALHGCCIVSGMALGIDGAAHTGALEAPSTTPIRTVAVVGTGLDRVYPKSHHQLAHDIHEHGLIISEFPLGTPPTSANFPQRNRIIAGLCRATLVVEAALQSGSLITAQQALEQGKDVLAIPGSIHSTQAKGCHQLIKQGAKLVESAADVLEEIGWAGGSNRTPPTASAATHTHSLSQDLQALLRHLGHDPCSFNALAQRTGLATPALQAQLTELELEGLVFRLPGGLFQSVASH